MSFRKEPLNDPLVTEDNIAVLFVHIIHSCSGQDIFPSHTREMSLDYTIQLTRLLGRQISETQDFFATIADKSSPTAAKNAAMALDVGTLVALASIIATMGFQRGSNVLVNYNGLFKILQDCSLNSLEAIEAVVATCNHPTASHFEVAGETLRIFAKMIVDDVKKRRGVVVSETGNMG